MYTYSTVKSGKNPVGAGPMLALANSICDAFHEI
jgi:hypothetical protein